MEYFGLNLLLASELLHMFVMFTGCRVNFRKECFMTIDSLDVRYDYHSVMHYGSFFFARERGMKTLRTKIDGVRIGQRERLSALDVQKGLLLYQCDKGNGKHRYFARQF